MVSKRVPSQFCNQAVILMRIVAVMSENYVRRNRLQVFKCGFKLGSRKRHKTILEGLEHRPFECGRSSEQSSRAPGFGGANSHCAENDPVKNTARKLLGQSENRPAATNLYVVRMRAEAEHVQRQS